MKKLISFFVIAAICAVIILAAFLAGKVQAAQSSARVFRFLGSYTNAYVILRDYDSGYVIDKTTGVAAAGETYAANPITATQNTTTGFWEANIPAMDVNYNVVLSIGDAAVPAYTDITTSWYYSPETNQTIDAAMPNTRGRLLIGN